MADIRPFRGLRYDEALTGDLSKVICPPYDIISPQAQEELYARSQHNFVRLEFGREFPQDSPNDNRYTRSAATLERWLSQGVLRPDERPAIYLHDHHFRFNGKALRRRGMVVRVRLEEWDRMVVRPHEGTFAGPRHDRLDLLWALRANTSPVLALFEDPERRVGRRLDAASDGPPAMQVDEGDGERHVVWAITDPESVDGICAALAESPLYIADGHHRYSSALAYRLERHAYSAKQGTASGGDEPFDFVMMTLVDLADPGLVILAPHRLVRGLPRPVLEGLEERLDALFEVEELPLSTRDVWRRVDELAMGEDTASLACRVGQSDSLLILRLRDTADVGPMMPSFHTPLFRRLDVSILDYVVLENLLGIDTAAGDARVAYNHDREDVMRRVQDEEYQLAFFLRPVQPGLVKTIADQGDRMPRKSTYFYPKTPVGLVAHRLV